MVLRVLSLCLLLGAARGRLCNSSQALYRRPGQATLLMYIGAHWGEECGLRNPQGLQIISSAAASLDALQTAFLPNVTLGLAVYETCSKLEVMQKGIVASLVEANCRGEYLIGALSEDRLLEAEEAARGAGLPLTLSHGDRADLVRMDLAPLVLSALGWSTVDFVVAYEAPFEAVYQFTKAATNGRVCILKQITMDKMNQMPKDSRVVVITPDRYIRSVLEGMQEQNFFVIPSDGFYTPVDVKPLELIIFVPTLVKTVRLENPFDIIEEEESNYTQLAVGKVSPIQVQMVSEMANMVTNFKYQSQKFCKQMLCPELPRGGFNASTYVVTKDMNHVVRALKLLNVRPEEFEGFLVLRQSEGLGKIGSFRMGVRSWVLEMEYNRTEGEGCNGSEECWKCENFGEDYGELREKYFYSLALKEEAWVAALLSISVVGILCCVAIAVFIGVRICKRDVLEGNPGCSFLMLLSLVFMYLSIVPFAVEAEGLEGCICGLRLFGTSLSFCFVYSVMLARSVMLASCDKDGGFMSHINGYIQSVLCFFIGAVQVGLAVQFWAVNWVLLDREECLAMSRGNLFLALLSYDVFLLVLLVCVSPFVARSKRNYNEGKYFTAGVWLSVAVWACWCGAYAALPPAWRDLAVCSGLVATATSLLVSVFIPRTYLMLSGMVRDHIVSALPSLAHTAATSVVDINYRSTQALYDSVAATRAAHLDQNYYVERPTTPSTARMDNKSPENTYERYDSPPSPQIITRF